MSAHTHTVITEGCYRCDLNKDEVQYSEDVTAVETVVERAIQDGLWPEDVAIDVAAALMNWARTKEGREVLARVMGS